MENIRLVGSKILEVSGKRNEDFSGELSLETNIQLVNLEKVKDSKETVRVDYIFKADYKELGEIVIKGVIFVSTSSKTVKELLKGWKDKKLETPEHVAVTNAVLQKASLRAFQIEEELGLPIHIRLPSLEVKKE